MGSQATEDVVFETRVLPVNITNLGQFEDPTTMQTWVLPSDTSSLESLREAAQHLRESNIPVGFPTETVYGLGADATRSAAVKGIYKAKGRPSDNPLIIHVCDLTMLQNLLVPAGQTAPADFDLLPAIYKPLIQHFWPGPLTILLPNPASSKLAPEVTAGLPSFGARMPASPLALSLIHLAGVPLAAPSANASTKPSPTTAAHVLHDLSGRISLILDGGACQVGVESTVVDGMCDPPVVLRPGGVSIDAIRAVEGWENVVRGYKDQSEIGSAAPRAPGMKYKHYSPKAKVVLYEACGQTQGNGTGISSLGKILAARNDKSLYLGLELLSSDQIPKIGIVRTAHWTPWASLISPSLNTHITSASQSDSPATTNSSLPIQQAQLYQGTRHIADLFEISLGSDTKDIARGLFAALRELDGRGVDVMFVEGIGERTGDDGGEGEGLRNGERNGDVEGDLAAAVMNRLRKAASFVEQ